MLSRYGAVMQMSLNARFLGEFPADARHEDLPGAWLARRIEHRLPRQGWATDEADFWRDRGWVVRCVRGRADLELSLAPVGPGWFLHVAPTRGGSLRMCIDAPPPSAHPMDCHALAQDVDACLRDTGACSELRWAWDADPDEVRATPSPPQPG
jgi:hypothetical protein